MKELFDSKKLFQFYVFWQQGIVASLSIHKDAASEINSRSVISNIHLND